MISSERRKIIDDILSRGVVAVEDAKHLRRKLEDASLKKAKLGIDPTRPDIHIGNMVPFLKLHDIQSLNLPVCIVIGDFTGMIGDTSDKTVERPMLDALTVRQNMSTYVKQLGRIIDLSKAEVVYNSTWLAGINSREFSEMCDTFSINEFIKRKKVKDRLDAGKRVSLRETLYSVYQAIDSLKIRSDLELGGSDQWFNLLAGRHLQQKYHEPGQDILTTELLLGLDGRKMSGSWGNTVNLTDNPKTIFGKIMSIPDALIIPYMINCTRIPIDTIRGYEELLQKDRVNPLDLKMQAAFEITKIIHGKNNADLAKESFQQIHQRKSAPDEKDIQILESEERSIIKLLIASGAVKSNNEAKQVIRDKGVYVNGIIVEDFNLVVAPGSIIQKGKRVFFKLK